MAYLFKPEPFTRLTPEEKARICNGAGPAGMGLLVPDHWIGVDITPAADIHDYMYYLGRTPQDKHLADVYFFLNMASICLECSNPVFLESWHGQILDIAPKAICKATRDRVRQIRALRKRMMRIVRAMMRERKLRWYFHLITYLNLRLAVVYFIAVWFGGGEYFNKKG